MDAGGTEPWMVKVDCAGSGQSRATHRAVAEGLGEILLDKSPSIPLFQRGKVNSYALALLLQTGKPELRRYTAVFMLKDQEMGQCSDDLVINYAP